MNEKERDEFLDSMYPVGKERWVKVKYLDRDKCMQVFRWPDDKVDEQGYLITALGVRDEYTPQIAALVDLQADVIAYLSHVLSESELHIVNELFRQRMDEVKSHTIRTGEH